MSDFEGVFSVIMMSSSPSSPEHSSWLRLRALFGSCTFGDISKSGIEERRNSSRTRGEDKKDTKYCVLISL